VNPSSLAESKSWSGRLVVGGHRVPPVKSQDRERRSMSGGLSGGLSGGG
jgi:hypothetical protein